MSKQHVTAILGVGPALGSALARRFAREGHKIALMSRTENYLLSLRDELKTKHGIEALAIPTDVTDQDSVKDAFKQIKQNLGAPNCMIYNAGFYHRRFIEATTAEDFEHSWKANCFGAFLATQQVMTDMMERKRQENINSTIIFTGASASLRGMPHFSQLAVGKAGLRVFAQSLAKECGPRGIHVAHVVIDGQINSPSIRQMENEEQAHQLLDPDAIAELYFNIHIQSANDTVWSHEIDLRTAVEKW